MANKVFLNKDGLIEEVYKGKQTFQSVVNTAAKVMLLADDLDDKKIRVRILVDVTGISSVTADALLASADSLKTIQKSKMALFGGSELINNLANLVIKATGNGKSVRIFKNRTLAEKWLKSG